jgi:hypothetical protein
MKRYIPMQERSQIMSQRVISILAEKLISSLEMAEYDSSARDKDWIAWAQAKADGREVREDGRVVDETKKGCPMPSHHHSCDCNGEGGDR